MLLFSHEMEDKMDESEGTLPIIPAPDISFQQLTNTMDLPKIITDVPSGL